MFYKITLLGYMGCGKSYVGKHLACYFNSPFYDLDSLISQQESQNIRDIFVEKGEQNFRKIENKVLKNIFLKKKYFILSVGGGTPCYYNNMHIINNNSITVYLSSGANFLSNRLMKEKSTRPIISSIDDNKLTSFIYENLRYRSLFYNKSKIKISIENKLIISIIEDIYLSIKRYLFNVK